MPPSQAPDLSREKRVLSSSITMGALLGVFVPYLLFLLPAPLAVLIARHGLRAGITTAAVSAVAVGIATWHPLTALMVLLVLGLGVTIGEALRDGLSLRQTLLIGWLVMIITQLLPYYAASSLLGFDIVAETERLWLQNMQKALEFGGQTVTEQQVAETANQVKTVFPAMIILSAGFLTLVNYWLTRRWMRQLGAEIRAIPPFSRWRFPGYFAWAYILGLGCELLQQYVDIPVLESLSTNLQLVAGTILMMQGLALAWAYLARLRTPKLLIAVVLVIASVMLPYLMQVFILIGLLDTWFDLRRIGRKRAEKA